MSCDGTPALRAGMQICHHLVITVSILKTTQRWFHICLIWKWRTSIKLQILSSVTQDHSPGLLSAQLPGLRSSHHPSESLYLFVSVKACCCLHSLSTFQLQNPHFLSFSHSCHLSLLLMLHLSLWVGIVAQGQSCSSPPAAPKQGATTITVRQTGDASPCACQGRA